MSAEERYLEMRINPGRTSGRSHRSFSRTDLSGRSGYGLAVCTGDAGEVLQNIKMEEKRMERFRKMNIGWES